MENTIQLNNSINRAIDLGFVTSINLVVKREDLIHPFISGNKYRKLKYNLIEARNLGFDTLLTFGGAYSNHIAAVASVGKQLNFKTIGIIRGEELITKVNDNPTLKFATESGMHLKFISRDVYKNKTETSFLKALKEEFGAFYAIPEGGTNALAVKGCEEILTEADAKFDYICCSVGTGGTISGIINSSKPEQEILGFPALKGDFLDDEIRKFAKRDNWRLINEYHFNGYAKINTELVEFINRFKALNGIQLDPIYTGKMLFGIYDLIQKKRIPENSSILAIHTGGLQGIEGMNKRLKNKQMTLIR